MVYLNISTAVLPESCPSAGTLSNHITRRVRSNLLRILFAFSQTPPALPTLPVVQLASKLQQSKLIVDWHNTAYSILGMRLGQTSRPTLVAKR